MAEATVGDDILGEDPTVDELEALSAKLMGKQAGLFVVSGTMANQVAISALTERGDEVLVGEETHIFNLEVGGLAAVSQVQSRPLCSVNGRFDPEQVRKAIRVTGIQTPVTRVLCLENTYNLNTGIPLPGDYMQAMADLAHQHRLNVYLDGARIFNAAAALGVDVQELAAPADALMFCLSKGLAAPFGAVLVGSSAFIEKASWIRQRLGGGMRQAGHMAAAGLVALREMRERLPEDHANAQRLAAGLAQIHPELSDPAQTLSNIVNLNLAPLGRTSVEVATALLARGIKIKLIGEQACRMVTHYGLSADDVDTAIEAIRQVLR